MNQATKKRNGLARVDTILKNYEKANGLPVKGLGL